LESASDGSLAELPALSRGAIRGWIGRGWFGGRRFVRGFAAGWFLVGRRDVVTFRGNLRLRGPFDRSNRGNPLDRLRTHLDVRPLSAARGRFGLGSVFLFQLRAGKFGAFESFDVTNSGPNDKETEGSESDRNDEPLH